MNMGDNHVPCVTNEPKLEEISISSRRQHAAQTPFAFYSHSLSILHYSFPPRLSAAAHTLFNSHRSGIKQVWDNRGIVERWGRKDGIRDRGMRSHFDSSTRDGWGSRQKGPGWQRG